MQRPYVIPPDRAPQPSPPAGPESWAGQLISPGLRTFDAVNDLVVPFLLVVMMLCFGFYAISVRDALMSTGNDVLGFVYFFFVVGAVGIAKIRSVRGNDAISLPYIAGLAFAITVFLAQFSLGVGGIAGGVSGPVAFASNVIVFAAAWAGINWIARDCTVDPNTEECASAGMFDAVPADRRRPGRSVVVFSLLAAAVFGLGQLVLARAHPGAYIAGLMAAGSYAVSALLLLALTNLSGLRLYIAARRLRVPMAMVPLWTLVSLLIVVFAVAVAWIAPRPGGHVGEFIASSDADMRGGDSGSSAGVTSGVSGRTGSAAYGHDSSGREGAPRGSGAGQGGGDYPGSSGAMSSTGDPIAGQGAGQGSGSGTEAEGEDEQAGEEGERRPGEVGGQGRGLSRESRPGSSGAQSAGQPPTPFVPPPGLEWFLKALVIVVGLAVLLAFLYALGRALWSALRGRGFAFRLPRFRFGRGRPPELRNPFADAAMLARLNPRDLVLRSYGAFMALAGLCGCPRPLDRTASEFVGDLPAPLLGLRDEARQLSAWYVEAEYAPSADFASAIPRLREIWTRMDALAESVLHPART